MLGLLALVALGLFAARDLPRRMIERRLSEALEGEVSVGALHLRGFRRLVLDDVRIDAAGILPWLRSARFPEVDAEVRLRSLLGGRIERLAVDGGSVELEARCDMALRLPEAAAGLEIGDLSVAGIDIGVQFAGRRTSAVGRLDLRTGAVGGAPWTGPLGLEADAADLETLFVLLAGEAAPACGAGDDDRTLVAHHLLVEGELLATEPPPASVALRGVARADELTVELAGRRLSVSEPRVELDWGATLPGRVETGFELGSLGRGQLKAELDGEQDVFRTFEGEVRELDLGILLPFFAPGVTGAEGQANLGLRLGEDGVGTWEGRAELALLDLSTSAASVQLEGIELETSGRLDRSRGTARLLFEGRSARGSLETQAGAMVEGVSLRLESEGEVRFTDGAPRLRLGSFSGDFGGRFEPWGEVEARATLDPEAGPQVLRGTWVWHGAELGALRSHFEDPNVRSSVAWALHGRAEGAGGFAGSLAEPSVWGRISLHDLAVAAEGLAAYRTETAGLDLRAQAGGPVEARWSSGGEVDLGELSAVPVEVEMTGRSSDGVLDLERGAVRLGGGGALGAITATATGRLDAPWGGTLGAEIDLSSWYELLFSEASSPLLPSGRLRARLDWELAEGGRWTGTGALELAEGMLASPDGSRVVAPLAWQWALRASGEGAAGAANLRGEIGGFQMLWDAVFADYAGVGLPIVVDLEGDWEGTASRAWQLSTDATFDLGAGAEARARLTRASGGGLAWRLDAHAGELAPVVEELVREPFAGGSAVLGRLSGSGALDLHLTGSSSEGSGEARGSVRGEGVGLVLGEELAIESLDLDLPLDVAWRAGEAAGDGRGLVVGGPARRGTIRFGRLEAVGVSIPATAANLEVEGETVRLVDRLSVPLLGGSAVLRDLRLSAGLSGDGQRARLESAVELDGLDLARITETFDLFRLEGRVAGGFPHVVVTRGEMQTRGSGELAFFGGAATLDQVAVTELFSRFPRLTFNARFEDLDLGQITRTLEFGEITGRVRGELRAVEVVGGVPVRFLGRMESVPTPGVSQRVSLKAANNLALLGTGTSRALGGGLLPRLFDRFPYVGLGMELALARDRFQLRGLLRRGDKELFLKGRLPLRLDVVNVRPGATVSFKTMMSRLSNLEIGRPEGESRERR